MENITYTYTRINTYIHIHAGIHTHALTEAHMHARIYRSQVHSDHLNEIFFPPLSTISHVSDATRYCIKYDSNLDTAPNFEWCCVCSRWHLRTASKEGAFDWLLQPIKYSYTVSSLCFCCPYYKGRWYWMQSCLVSSLISTLCPSPLPPVSHIVMNIFWPQSN